MGGDLVTEQAKLFLSECGRLHEDCPRQISHKIPARIIDVGFEDGSEALRLHITENGERAPYVALSYCWGGPQQFTTTSATIQQRINGIPMTELPQTIQDAIKITRKLGFQYLWVDALCILQDSAVDKHSQINKMGEIYKNATLTIAAENSYSVRHGFLKARHNRQGCVLPLRLPGGSLGKIGLIEEGSTIWRGGPLSTRAWTLQEFLLSPRLLLYGEGEVIWQCQSTNLRPLLEISNRYEPLLQRLPSGVLERNLSSRGKSKADQTKMWGSLIESYSGRDYTIKEDRMLAISGIASELGKFWSDVYLAGMWKRCLLEHLGWMPIKSKGPENVEDLGCAPSWSWLSFNGAVDTCEIMPEVDLIDCTVQLVNQSEIFGQVLGGKLCLYGAIIHSSKLEGVVVEVHDTYLDSESFEMPEAGCWILRLGLVPKHVVGLILVQSGDGLFKRVGCIVFIGDAEDLWAGAERKSITIV